MATKRITLSQSWISQLLALPEKGMGYHLVKIILKNGKVLRKHKVLNSSVLVLEEHENFVVEDIAKIQPEV